MSSDRGMIFRGATLALAAWLLAGCVAVQPWERGRLAHDCMQVPVDEGDAAALGKVEAVREGSSGGMTSSGGGCGCN